MSVVVLPKQKQQQNNNVGTSWELVKIGTRSINLHWDLRLIQIQIPLLPLRVPGNPSESPEAWRPALAPWCSARFAWIPSAEMAWCHAQRDFIRSRWTHHVPGDHTRDLGFRARWDFCSFFEGARISKTTCWGGPEISNSRAEMCATAAAAAPDST